jgi:hypothetical protein
MDGFESIKLSLIAFGCIFGSTVLGVVIMTARPDTFSTPQIRDILKSARDVIVGVAALTLGLLIATAKSSFDEKNSQLRIEASKAIMLDRQLYLYGPEANETRRLIKTYLQGGVDKIENITTHGIKGELERQKTTLDELYLKILQLKPTDPVKGELKSTSASLTRDIMQSRWLLQQSINSAIQLPLLGILIFWLSCIFLNLGMMSSHNLASIASLSLAALSMTGAIYLTLAFDRPYQGLIRISSAPFKTALQQLMPL